MSNQHNNLAISTEEQLELLTKALLREKSARKMLEAKIAELNETKFEATKELLESYETARIRQIQLEFLSFLNREKIEHKSIPELITFFVENVLQLLEQKASIIYQRRHTEIDNIYAFNASQLTWQNLPLTKEMAQQLNALIPQKNSTWIRSKLTDSVKASLAFFHAPLLLSLRIPQNSNMETVILINIEHYCYSEDFKKTLDIAANQLTEIIAKKSTDTKLLTNYSQLKKTVKLLKKTQQQLIHNEKMVSLGQMAAGVAHEINNPLSYLSSNLETLQDYVQQYDGYISHCLEKNNSDFIDQEELVYLKEDSVDLINACLNGIKRVSDIVINLKQFSKKGSDEFMPVDLLAVISDSLAIVSNKLKYNYTLETKHQADSLMVNGSFGQLQQVFVNLFINAIDAMPNKGTLSIETKHQGEQITIHVKDDGIGMASETINKIFEPFYTTKDETKGTGLGLSVSYAIITKHNATISVDSKENQGTQFTLVFPVLSNN